MKFRSPFGLNSIVSSFQKTLTKLEKFQEKNSKKIKTMKNELDVKEREQERAEQIATNIKEFLSLRDEVLDTDVETETEAEAAGRDF